MLKKGRNLKYLYDSTVYLPAKVKILPDNISVEQYGKGWELFVRNLANYSQLIISQS